MSYLLGVDIGTTAIKAAVFDLNGVVKGACTCEYELDTPQPNRVELEADKYVDAFKSALTGALGDADISKHDVLSLGMSSQGETLLCLDESLNPLRPAIVWLDNRAQEEAKSLELTLGRELIHKTTGQVEMSAIWPASKILWLRNNDKYVFEKTKKFALVGDYLTSLLTGRLASDDSLLCSTMYWSINTREYWPEMLEHLGIEESQLPEICHPGTPVGHITSAAAERFGLSENTLVCLGALDQACGAIGVGNVRPGIFSEGTGAALASVATTTSPVIDPRGEMPCFAAGIPGMYMVHAFSTGGIAIRWFRDKFFPVELENQRSGGPNVYSLIDQEVKNTRPGADGLRVIPHIQGSGPPDTNDEAKASFSNVTIAHSRGHFARGLMEGVAMVLKSMVEGTKSLGVDVTEIRSLSGGAKSDAWCQIKADATGLPVRTMKTTDIAACLGAAILAGVGADIWQSVAEAADDIAEYELKYDPDSQFKPLYDEMYTNYKVMMRGSL